MKNIYKQNNMIDLYKFMINKLKKCQNFTLMKRFRLIKNLIFNIKIISLFLN